jgi:protein-tyrosine-phosphatase
MLAALLPPKPRAFARRLVQLEPRVKWVFLAEALRRLARRGQPAASHLPTECRHVVFACAGNILRSPFAAAVFTQSLADRALAGVAVSSAGLHAHPGSAADPRGLSAARAVGVNLAAHRARLLTADVVRGADVIVAMDYANQAEFLARFPDARAKLRLLGAFDPDGPRSSVEIHDPYMMDADGVRRCYDDVRRCVRGLLTEFERQL